MGRRKFREVFEENAIKQITGRGYSVADVSPRSGVSPLSLYAWNKQYDSDNAATDEDRSSGIKRLKQELIRVTEERDILK